MDKIVFVRLCHRVNQSVKPFGVLDHYSIRHKIGYAE